MFRVISSIFELFRAGQAVSNPSAWKNSQLVGNLLIAIVALVAAFGFDLGLSDAEIAGGAVFITAVINGVFVVITSKKVGLPAQKTNIDYIVDSLVAELNDSSRVQHMRDSTSSEKERDFNFPTDRNG